MTSGHRRPTMIDGPDEEFTMTFELIAVDDPRAVVRLEVRYGPPKLAGRRFLTEGLSRTAPAGRAEECDRRS
jgi:hypothetical protein